jgi:phosphatidate cytidylyltransferase
MEDIARSNGFVPRSNPYFTSDKARGMSPQAALASPVFRLFAALVLAIAIVSWLSLWALARAGRDTTHAGQSFRAWLIMAPTALLAVFLGRVAAIAFIFGLALAGFWEYARATGLVRDRMLVALAMALVAALAADVLLAERLLPYADWYQLYLALPLAAIVLIVCLPIVRNRTAGELPKIALALFGFLYIGWMFGHLALLANGPNAYGYLMYLIFAVEINDIAAYVFGRLLGRHKLRSQLSPNKTWEGALGGLAVSLALPWLLRISFPHFGPIELVLTGLIVGIGGTLGDLAMSLIKREAGLKDMGSLLPGHGGILDRIDSLILVAPLFVHLVRVSDGLNPAKG